MEIGTIVQEAVNGVKKHGGRVVLGAALAASAITLVRPVEVRADGGPVCRTNLILENPAKIVDGDYFVNGKASFRVETTLVNFPGNRPNDILIELDKATLSTDGVPSQMKPEDIDPDAVEMEKIGSLGNGDIVFSAKVKPEAARNMTRVNITLSDGSTCTAENESDAMRYWRANFKKSIEQFFPAIKAGN